MCALAHVQNMSTAILEIIVDLAILVITIDLEATFTIIPKLIVGKETCKNDGMSGA